MAESQLTATIRGGVTVRAWARLLQAWVVVAAVWGLVFLPAGAASGSEAFAQGVKDHLELSCVPQCTLCHSVNPGTASTFGTKFGFKILSTGLLAKGDGSSVGPALDKLRADGSDVDGDDVNDIEQIINNSNPNQNGDTLCGPTFGCGASVAPRGSSGYGAILVGLFLSLAAGVHLRRVRAR